MTAYDPENIFGKILRGELPSQKVFDDDASFAFLDIMPRADGHTLVSPKTPARNMLDASPAQIAAVMATVQRVSHAALKAYEADGITLQQFNETAGGQEVFHLHFHIHPRHAGVPMRPAGKMGDMDAIKGHAERSSAQL